MAEQKIILDKRDKIDRVNGFRNLLAVDAYTGWAEAVPAKADDVKTVITFLINKYIPTHKLCVPGESPSQVNQI